MISASCSCGQLKLSFDGEITRTSICHCYACQQRTGSVFGVQTRLDRSKIKVDGQSTLYNRRTDEGDHVRFYFCPKCGSTVFWEIDDFPQSVCVPIGAFEKVAYPSPVFSVYEVRKHPWVQLPDSVTEHWD